MVRDRSFEQAGDEMFPVPDRGENTEVTGTVSSGANLRIVAAIAAAVAALIAVPLLLGGGDEDLVAGRGDAPAGSDGALSDGETSTTVPGVAVRYVDEAPTTTTTTSKTQELIAPTTAVATTLPAGEYLLGEATDLWLFYGGEDPLQRLNLDNGELVEVGMRAVPLAATGEDIVVFQPTSSVFGWVLAQDPGEQALGWRRGPAALGPESGQLWIMDSERDMEHPAGVEVGPGRWELLDLESVRALDRRPGDLSEEVEAAVEERMARGLEPWNLRQSPDLTQRSDGVYRYDPDGYTRLHPGWVLAADNTRALVETCDEGGSCSVSWISVLDGSPMDLPIPTGNVVGAEFVADGSWLRWLDDVGWSRFIDLETGSEFSLVSDERVALSPNARWIALHLGSRLQIFDLLSPTPDGRYERVIELETFRVEDGGQLLFVDQTGQPAG